MDVTRVGPDGRELGETCARLMAASERWITLRRSFDSAVRAVLDPGKELYVVSAESTIQAFVLLDLRGPLNGYVQSIFVRAEARGRGLGSSLLGWAEERIFRQSPNVFLCVSSFNVAARRLYERLGYREAGRLEGFVVREHDEILLRKTRRPWSEFRPTAAAPGS